MGWKIIIPEVKEIINQSYKSVKECIADFLESSKTPKTRVDTQAKIAELIYLKVAIVNASIQKNDLLVLFGLQWSNDFYPNSSIKSNR